MQKHVYMLEHIENESDYLTHIMKWAVKFVAYV